MRIARASARHTGSGRRPARWPPTALAAAAASQQDRRARGSPGQNARLGRYAPPWVRNSVPTLPGSWIRSNSTQFSSTATGSSSAGGVTRNATPCPLSTLATDCINRASSARQRESGTAAASAAISG
ncbi:hypothetical protein G6F35_016564 [Rhizopus arrhizus]|nr:hypothetical protein G6F35_016564 [Rhizopus arrhizus]